MERVFRKAFRILGLGEGKGRWVMEQDFHGDLQVNLAWFLPFSPFFHVMQKSKTCLVAWLFSHEVHSVIQL